MSGSTPAGEAEWHEELQRLLADLQLFGETPERLVELALHIMNGESGEAAEAERCLRRALALEPNHVEANLELGFLLDAVADAPSDALPFFERAMQTAPDADATYGYARCLAQVGRRSEALRLIGDSSFAEHDDLTKLRREIESGLWNR